MARNKENAQKWVNALRSGKYEQNTDGMLKDGEHNLYCCLGVALDLFDGEGWIQDKNDNLVHRNGVRGMANGYPKRSWYERIFGTRRGIHEYAGMNDSGKTFEEIATQIEKDFDLVS